MTMALLLLYFLHSGIVTISLERVLALLPLLFQKTKLMTARDPGAHESDTPSVKRGMGKHTSDETDSPDSVESEIQCAI
jgi:hypothetical protein